MASFLSQVLSPSPSNLMVSIMTKKTIELKVPEIGSGTICIMCLLFIAVSLLFLIGWKGFLFLAFITSFVLAMIGATLSFVDWIENL